MIEREVQTVTFIEIKTKQQQELEEKYEYSESNYRELLKQKETIQNTCNKLQEQINQLAIQHQITNAHNVENQESAMKLKQIIDEKEIQIDQLQKEISRLAVRLCTAESKLFEYQ